MASGGQQTPSRGLHPSSNQVNQHGGNDFGDSQWNLLPNNLELSSRSRPAKKQRNKEKIRKVVSTESSPSPQSSPCTTRNCNHPYTSASYPRTKFTATSWHNEQLASSSLKKNMTSSDMEETPSDAEQINMERRNAERAVSQRHQESRFPETQTPSSRRAVMDSEHGRTYKEDNTKKVPDASIIIERLIHLRECIKQVSSIMQTLEKSDEHISREQMNNHKLDQMLSQLHQEEEEHLELLQQMLDSNNAAEVNDGQATSHIATPGSFAVLPSREVNGISEEERLYHNDQILRKMVESQKKLTALQQQQEALMSLQKKANDKLAEAQAFHEHLVKASSSDGQQDRERTNFQSQDWHYASSDRSFHSTCVEEPVPNGNADWEGEQQSDIQVVWQPLSTRSERKTPSSQGKRNSNTPSGWQEETREMAATNALNANLEDLRHTVQLLQEMNDNRKMATHCDDNQDDLDREAASVEWHRQKLENKLRELQEKKQQMNQLLQELSTLQKASKSGIQQTDASGDNDAPVETVDSLRDAQQFLDTVDTGEKKRKLDQMKETLRQLKAMVNNIGAPTNGEASEHENADQQVQKEKSEPLVPQQHRQLSQTKRDNISREQCSGFPARRHYEAEGRANEDTDVAPPLTSNSPAAGWDTDPRIQEKMRQLQDAKDKLQKVQGLLAVVQQSKSTGETLPADYLQLLSSLDDEEEPGDVKPKQRKDQGVISQNSASKNLTDSEISMVQRRPREKVRIDDVEERIQLQENTLEHLMEERNRILSLQDQLARLQQTPEASVRNNDQIRSSGEGDSLQKRSQFSRSGPVFSPSSDAEHVQPLRDRTRQGNLLLTRQNVAIMESQAQATAENNTTVKARDIASVKKDNINSLSANLTRKILANSPACLSSEQSLEGKAGASFSALSAELNQTLSLRAELCRKKTALEELLGQDQSKQQSYSRNQDTQSHSGSSVISGPLEGSSSVLAPDTTVAATWGGSSTQDNFENEVEEPVESLEEQEEGSGNESQAEGSAHHDQSRYISMQQFNGDQVYVDHDTTASAPLVRRDNRIVTKQGYKSQENQQTSRKNFHMSGANRKLSSAYEGIHQENIPADAITDEQEGVIHQPSSIADSSSSFVHWHKFTQQFQQQLEHMNALCQSVLQEQQVLTSRLLSCSINSPTLVPSRSSHPFIPDLLHQYTHQLQQQQQLLLSLSQCYHMLYLQQIEIQHLQKCLQQIPDSDGSIHQTSALNNQGPSTEEFSLRPWPLAPMWNTPLSFSQTQPSSLPASSFIQQSSFGYSPSHPAPNVTGCSSQNIRNNSGPEGRVAAETLNNQVPPRTRANNFWDNFRSYSRQNLLSTSAATKSNETGSVGGGQARFSSQQSSGTEIGSCWNSTSRTRETLQPHVENGAIVSQANEDKQLDRPLPNPELQEMMTRPKKPNFNKHQVSAGRSASETVRRSPASLNLSSSTSLDQLSRPSTLSSYTGHTRSSMPHISSSNSITTSAPCHQHHVSKLRESSSGNASLPFGSVQESIYAEVAKLVAQNESHPDFLMELFQQLQQIHSDYLRQRALCAVRDMVTHESNELRHGAFLERTEVDDNQNMSHISKDIHLQGSHSHLEVQEQHSIPDGTSDMQHISSTTSDQSGPGRRTSGDAGHFQENITLLSARSQSKSGLSTGAVKKKTSKSIPSHSNLPQHISPVSTELEGLLVQQNGLHKLPVESIETQVERVVLSLVPFISSHSHEECSPQFQAQLINRVLEALQTLPQQHLSRLFRSQILQNTLSRFTGKRISSCENEMLVQITNVLFNEVALHKLAKRKAQMHAEDNHDGPSETTKDNNTAYDIPPSPQMHAFQSEKDENAVAPNEFTSDELKAQKEITADYSEEAEEITRGDRKTLEHHSSVSLVNISEQELSRGIASGETNSFVSRAASRNPQGGVRTAEEDMGCECDTEAETEPEVEAETEADLAEADQSPSQLGATVDQLTRQIESSLSVPDAGATASVSLLVISSVLQNVSVNGAAAAYVEDSIRGEDEHNVNEDPVAQGAFTDGSLIQELTLDDIPIKLSPTPEELIQRHSEEEQPVNSLHQEPLGDGELTVSTEGEVISETTAPF